MQKLPHTKSCFVCGESNPLGLQQIFETDGKIVHARFVPRAEHVGFKQTIHGGLLATLLDEIMVWACAVATQRFAFCAELNVRFLKPARPGEELHGTAELVSNRKDKLFETRGELRNGKNEIVASATGKYLALKEADAAGMLDDFVGDARSYFPLTVM
jgi:uncharacterized protein (TIGR00369 family)